MVRYEELKEKATDYKTFIVYCGANAGKLFTVESLKELAETLAKYINKVTDRYGALSVLIGARFAASASAVEEILREGVSRYAVEAVADDILECAILKMAEYYLWEEVPVNIVEDYAEHALDFAKVSVVKSCNALNAIVKDIDRELELRARIK